MDHPTISNPARATIETQTAGGVTTISDRQWPISSKGRLAFMALMIFAAADVTLGLASRAAALPPLLKTSAVGAVLLFVAVGVLQIVRDQRAMITRLDLDSGTLTVRTPVLVGITARTIPLYEIRAIEIERRQPTSIFGGDQLAWAGARLTDGTTLALTRRHVRDEEDDVERAAAALEAGLARR